MSCNFVDTGDPGGETVDNMDIVRYRDRARVFCEDKAKKQLAWHAILKWDEVFALETTKRGWIPLSTLISAIIIGIVAGSFVDLLLLSSILLNVIFVVNNDGLPSDGPHFWTNVRASSARRRRSQDLLHWYRLCY